MPRLNRLLFKSGSKGQAGFTLIEVLIAITIFAIGLLAIAGMQMTAIQTNSTASEITARAALAEGIMEEILSGGGPVDFNAVDPAEPLVVWDFGGGTEYWVDGAGRFRATYRIIPDQPITGVSQVEVQVISDAGRNLGRTVTITSIRRR